jgi:hypothetical protein
MFCARAFAPRMFAPRYFAKTGGTSTFNPVWAINSNQWVGFGDPTK